MCCKPLSSLTQMSTHKMKSTSNLFVFYMQGTVYRMECQLECFGNDFGNIGLLQSSCLMDSMDIHTRKSTKCKSVRTCWTTVKLMKTVSISNDNNGVTTVSQNQNDSSWNGSMEIPAERKSLRCSYQVICTVFFNKKGVILLDSFEPGQQTVNFDAKFVVRIFRFRSEKTTFLFFNMIMPGSH